MGLCISDQRVTELRLPNKPDLWPPSDEASNLGILDGTNRCNGDYSTLSSAEDTGAEGIVANAVMGRKVEACLRNSAS